MRRFRTLTAAVVLLVLGLIGARPIGPLPALGPFLDPARGAWSLLRAAAWPREAELSLPGLSAPVELVLDHRGVPHIFASTTGDAYRALGWIVARERLFQLELTTRATAGTLAELLGPRLLDADREARALGLARAADRRYAALRPGDAGRAAMEAYAEGVNAWIDAMAPQDLPLEYRLLRKRPARWKPEHTLYLFAGMGLTLASEDPAEPRLAVQALVGEPAAEALVPRNSPVQQPIQPNGGSGPRYALVPLPPPGRPDSAAALVLALRRAVLGEVLAPARRDDGDLVLGSNNWAVAPSRTTAGHALLAGDPHLRLTLPSIWYEAHLVVPGALDVAGVSLPGSPGITIGFNRDLAWSFTNTGSDVLDLYVETVDDSLAPARYQLDGGWRPIELEVETYRGPDGSTLAVDTVRFTHRGPMHRARGRWISMRWTVLEPSSEIEVFGRAAAATTAEAWLEAMRDYQVPTQNGLVADRNGTIAIRSSGWYPVRPNGRGDVIADGSTSASDWNGRLPVEQYPFAIQPGQGFLVSANQQPVDPAENPVYLGGNWPAPWRAIRINSLLRSNDQMTPDEMRRMHTDPGSARAEAFFPLLLNVAREEAARDHADPRLGRAAVLLGEWKGSYRPDDERAILFELMMRELPFRIWDELIPIDEPDGRPVHSTSQTLYQALHDTLSVWWDDRRTNQQAETWRDVITHSLTAALDTALARYGEPEAGGWRWGRVWPTDIWHLLRLRPLSRTGLAVQGGPETIAPAGRNGEHGASWRMVVELGDSVRAWGTYPGGQSGNPASPDYANRVDQWTRGELDTVLFPRSAADLPAARVRTRYSLRPAP